MDAVAQREDGPLVSLEQAVGLAKHHTWARVGFTIGVITYGMAVVVAAREAALPESLTAGLYLGGTAAIGTWGLRWHRGAKRTMASASVVDHDGFIVGRADRVARAELSRRAWPCAMALVAWWAVSMPLDMAFPSEEPAWWKVLTGSAVALVVWLVARRRNGARNTADVSRLGHKTVRPRQVEGDDAPIPTHGPRQRRGTARRRR